MHMTENYKFLECVTIIAEIEYYIVLIVQNYKFDQF